jgi:hypothetical protein
MAMTDKVFGEGELRCTACGEPIDERALVCIKFQDGDAVLLHRACLQQEDVPAEFAPGLAQNPAGPLLFLFTPTGLEVVGPDREAE